MDLIFSRRLRLQPPTAPLRGATPSGFGGSLYIEVGRLRCRTKKRPTNATRSIAALVVMVNVWLLTVRSGHMTRKGAKQFEKIGTRIARPSDTKPVLRTD